MHSRDNELWLNFWRDRRSDFHQKTVNPLLARFWPKLNLSPESRIFVPLCGKSLDMIWLAKQGHQVIGVELSPIAVQAFFSENRLKPIRRKLANFSLWQHRNISILCGDYFSLTPHDLGQIDTVYDRAALTALPEDIRELYVAHLRAIVPETSQFFLLTVEDAAPETSPQDNRISEEITSLYAKDFEIDLVHVESALEIDQALPDQPPEQVEYKAYRLTAKYQPDDISIV